MKLIVGLGNPGKEYENTRHNLGFMVVDQIVQSSKFKVQSCSLEFKNEKKFQAEICQLTKDILVAKPQTYMNESGKAVFSISQYFKIPASDIWVVHDDLDFPLGFLKIRFGGSSGGHKGVESIINSLGTDKFWRFRVGIGSRDQISLPCRQAGKIKYQKLRGQEDYVLRDFASEEKEKAKEMIKKGSDAVKYALEKGLEEAMNKYNSS